jgi:UrcA family protein
LAKDRTYLIRQFGSRGKTLDTRKELQMNTISILVAAGVMAALSTTSIQAQEVEPQTVSVRTSDLNLSTTAGQDELMRRIKRAATRVCEDANDVRDLQTLGRVHACREAAIAGAVSAIKGGAEVAVSARR